MPPYYCPNGHNVTEWPDECGACGAVMTTDDSGYNAVHERIEDEGIAACERELAAIKVRLLKVWKCPNGCSTLELPADAQVSPQDAADWSTCVECDATLKRAPEADHA